MAAAPSYKDMSLKEFINLPNVVELYSKYSSYLVRAIKDRPFIKIGKIVRGDYAVLYIDSSRIYDLFKDIGTAQAELFPNAMGLLGMASLEAAGIVQVQRQPYLNLRGSGTLIGIVDTGIDFTRQAFKYEDGTSKIRYIWDQTIEGNSPDAFLYGSEYTGEQINQALRSDAPRSIVPSTDTVGHGTFLASVAAGRQDNEYIGAAPDAQLLVVKLKQMSHSLYNVYAIPEDTQNVFSEADVMLAIEYMIDKAGELNMPLAICIGVGTNMSGHDGFTNLEEYISLVSQIPGICICAGAGNESSARHHTSGTLPGVGSTYDIEVRVPNDAGSFLMQIWTGLTDRVSVSLESPLGEVVPRVVARSGVITRTKLVLEKSSTAVQYYFPVAGSGAQLISVEFFSPTPGVWKIRLYGDIILNGRFDAWLPLTGLVTPGTEFINPDPYTTIVAPATSAGCITCGAYDDRTGSLYANSSWGFTRVSLIKPDLVAPGVNVTGIYPTGGGIMTGTSVAAAITAGASALMLQWGIVEGNDASLNTPRIKAFLIRGAGRDPNISYPSPQWGYGKLDLFNTFIQLRS